MKILLDECVTKKLKSRLPDFEVFTVTDMGWNGLKNGNLMRVAIDSEFDVLLTIDKNIEFQQNLNQYEIIVAVFDVERSKISYLETLLPPVSTTLTNLSERKVIPCSARRVGQAGKRADKWLSVGNL